LIEGLERRRMLDPDPMARMMLTDGCQGVGNSCRLLRTRDGVLEASDVFGGQARKVFFTDCFCATPNGRHAIGCGDRL